MGSVACVSGRVPPHPQGSALAAGAPRPLLALNRGSPRVSPQEHDLSASKHRPQSLSGRVASCRCEALQLMREGDRWEIILPSDLGEPFALWPSRSLCAPAHMCVCLAPISDSACAHVGARGCEWRIDRRVFTRRAATSRMLAGRPFARVRGPGSRFGRVVSWTPPGFKASRGGAVDVQVGRLFECCVVRPVAALMREKLRASMSSATLEEQADGHWGGARNACAPRRGQ